MRVVHVALVHRPLDTRIFYKECRTLAAAGYEVHLVVADPPAAELDGVRLHAIPPLPARKLACNPLKLARWLRDCYRVAAELRGDLYHFHEFLFAPAAALLKRRGASVIYDVHEDWPAQRLLVGRTKGRPWEGRIGAAGAWACERIARRTCNHFVAATPKIASKFPQAMTTTVQNFPLANEVIAEAEGSTPYTARSPQVLFLGGMTKARGLQSALAAIELLPPRLAARLRLAGWFSPASFERELRAEPGWRHVDYEGVVDRAAARQLLAEARLGLVLFEPAENHTDAYPTKMFEYMAAGLPVLASNFTLWQEIITGAGCGLTVDPRDPQAIAASIAWLLDHPAEAAAMGRRGRHAIETRFRWEREAEKLLGVYEQLLPGDSDAGKSLSRAA